MGRAQEPEPTCRQRLQGQGRERAARDAGGVRQHRASAQRVPLCGRRRRRRRAGQRGQDARPSRGRHGAVSGREGRVRQQGRAHFDEHHDTGQGGHTHAAARLCRRFAQDHRRRDAPQADRDRQRDTPRRVRRDHAHAGGALLGGGTSRRDEVAGLDLEQDQRGRIAQARRFADLQGTRSCGQGGARHVGRRRRDRHQQPQSL